MKILVIGGSGLIGKRLVNKLRAGGHDAIPASPSSGVNALTGQGLAEALQGVEVVVDVSNSPSFEDAAVLAFFETSTRNLLAAEIAADIKHHVALSIVGADRLPNIGYMRAKVAQEALIKASPVPYTIVRATQFFEFIGQIADGYTQANTVTLSPILMQPIAAADVSNALAEVAVKKAENKTIELAGPDKLRLDQLARRVLGARHDTRQVVTDSRSDYFGGEVKDDSLTAENAQFVGATGFEDWLKASIT